MKFKMPKFLFPLLAALIVVTGIAFSEQFPDIIVTSPNGIWLDTRAYSSLSSALTAVGSDQRDLYIVRSEAITTGTVNANTHLHFLNEGAINNSGALQINTKDISAPNHQIFTGSGDIDFISGSTVKSAWFADLPTALSITNDDTLSLEISNQCNVTSYCSVGDNVTLLWTSPGNFIIANAGTVMSNIHSIIAGPYQLFAGAGDFDFVDGIELRLSWFKRLRLVLTWVESEYVTIIVDKSEDLDYSDTAASNENLKILPGNILDGSAGTETLTVNGGLAAGEEQQIFGSNVTVAGLSYARPEWWGIDGTADDVEIQKAITAAGAGGEVELAATTYNTIARVDLLSGQYFHGQSVQDTIISTTGVTAIYSPEFASEVHISDLTVDGDDTASTYGIHIYKNPRKTVIERVKIIDYGTVGTGGVIYLEGVAGNTWGVTIQDVIGESCGRGIIGTNAQAITLIHNTLRFNAGPSKFTVGGSINFFGGIYEKVASAYGATDGNGYDIVLDGISKALLDGVYFETSRDGLLHIKDSELITVTNSHLRGSTDDDVDYGQVYIENSTHCRISHNNIAGQSGTFTGTANIYLDATSNYNIVEGNILEDDGSYSAGNFNIIDLGNYNYYSNNNMQNLSGDFIGAAFSDDAVTRYWISGQYVHIKTIPTFVDEDATPYVGSLDGSRITGSYMANGESIFKTANTQATVITDFDGGIIGQRIQVIINDALTTVDFTGTNLKGNGGADWSAAQNDVLECIFDGTNWYCDISDNSA